MAEKILSSGAVVDKIALSHLRHHDLPFVPRSAHCAPDVASCFRFDQQVLNLPVDQIIGITVPECFLPVLPDRPSVPARSTATQSGAGPSEQAMPFVPESPHTTAARLGSLAASAQPVELAAINRLRHHAGASLPLDSQTPTREASA